MENKKTEAKIFFQANKEKLQKSSREYHRNLSEDEKIKNRNYANIRNKNKSETDRERKKSIRKKLT